jgi:hypothetical protein
MVYSAEKRKCDKFDVLFRPKKCRSSAESVEGTDGGGTDSGGVFAFEIEEKALNCLTILTSRLS